ncbi:MAG TPA: hypothetical protein VF870_02270, partial [Ignavibacteriaceae bacterium]
MKTFICVITFIFLALPLLAQQKDLTGIWTGKLALPNSMELTIVFNLSQNDSGIYSSTLDSPDQGAKGIPTESTTLNGDSILIKIPVVQGFYA